MFVKISTAYKCLSDSELRSGYDASGKRTTLSPEMLEILRIVTMKWSQSLKEIFFEMDQQQANVNLILGSVLAIFYLLQTKQFKASEFVVIFVLGFLFAPALSSFSKLPEPDQQILLPILKSCLLGVSEK